MITSRIHELVSRDWQAARESKDAYWAERIVRLGPLEGLRIADELRRQVQLQDPSWPRDEDRRADVAAHARLAQLLHRAGPTSRR